MSNKKTFTHGQARSYVSPVVDVLNCQSEGLLCGSGDLTIKDWERDDEALDFNN